MLGYAPKLMAENAYGINYYLLEI